MKHFISAAVAATALLVSAGSASALIVVDHTVANQLYGLDSGVMLEDFDNPTHPHVLYVGNEVTTAEVEHPVSTSAPPPYTGAGAVSICCVSGTTEYLSDPTDYASVQGGSTATFSALDGYYLTSFSFYMGSPDTYNHVTFNLVGGGHQTFDSDAIWGGSPPGTGLRTDGFRVYYDFNGAKVSSITFASDTNAFEYDGLAGTVAVPEPATWAMMIMGFGAIGSAIRAQRRRQTPAFAA